ncbi:MAG: hypothetical protein WAT33_02360 [Giesbergeria sp.]
MHDTDAKKPTGSLNSTAGDTDTPTVANAQATDKAFPRLRAAFALKGHRLHRRAEHGSAESFWAERWGLVRYLPSLHDAALFLAQIGGRL